MAKFIVMNDTDGIMASPDVFTNEEADQFIQDFPKRFERQGYYKTARGYRIPYDEIAECLILTKIELTQEAIDEMESFEE
jgi:hypothetical protein